MESHQEKFLKATQILEHNQSLDSQFSGEISWRQSEALSSYEDLLDADKKAVEISEEINKQSPIYQFFKNTEPYIYDLQDLEEKQKELFDLFLQTASNKNQNQAQQETFIQELKNIQTQRGRLSYEELSYLMRNAIYEDTQTEITIEERLKQVIDWIASAYEQIHQEREWLLQQSYLFAYLLCDAQAYKNSYKGDCVFVINNKKELIDFLDSLSPKKWQELEELLKNTQEYKMFSKVFDSSTSLVETLWVLYNQAGAYNAYNLAVSMADFYRWMYFALREKVQQGLKQEPFLWEDLWEKLDQEQNYSQNLNSKEVDFLMQDLVIQAEKDRLSKLILETQNEYFDTLNMLSIFFEIQLEFISIDSFCQDLSILENRQLCFQEILNGMGTQTQVLEELKYQKEKNRQKILYYAPAIIQNLKESNPP